MKHDQISLIQNGIWAAYKKFRETKDIRQFSNSLGELRDTVDQMQDEDMLLFYTTLSIAYAGIVNKMKGWE